LAWIPHRSSEPLRTGGDPFSHPSGSSASWRSMVRTPFFRTERSGPGRWQVPTPFGSVFLVTGLLPRPLPFWPAAVALASRPILVTPGSRKLSVPGRVHSVPESCGSQVAWGRPGSNPFLTHDTVESPAKFLSRRYLKNRERPLPISPMALGPTPFTGWRPLSKSFRLHRCVHKFAMCESSRFQSDRWLKRPTPFTG